MSDTAFDTAQAQYDAMQPDDFEMEPRPAHEELKLIIRTLVAVGTLDQDNGHEDVHSLSHRQATVGIWIAGHEYSLTLNRED